MPIPAVIYDDIVGVVQDSVSAGADQLDGAECGLVDGLAFV